MEGFYPHQTRAISGPWPHAPFHQPWFSPQIPLRLRTMTSPMTELSNGFAQPNEPIANWEPRCFPTVTDPQNAPHSLKRKLANDDFDGPSHKQFITEQQMVDHMQELHISGEYKAHGSQSFSEMEVEENHQPRLIVCDQLKNFKQDDILPRTLIERNRPSSMALVLWQPPSGVAEQILNAIGRADDEDEHSNQTDNNNTSFVNLNMS